MSQPRTWTIWKSKKGYPAVAGPDLSEVPIQVVELPPPCGNCGRPRWECSCQRDGEKRRITQHKSGVRLLFCTRDSINHRGPVVFVDHDDFDAARPWEDLCAVAGRDALIIERDIGTSYQFTVPSMVFDLDVETKIDDLDIVWIAVFRPGHVGEDTTYTYLTTIRRGQYRELGVAGGENRTFRIDLHEMGQRSEFYDLAPGIDPAVTSVFSGGRLVKG